VSDNITVRSIVGRFLEHARVFSFENGGKPETYLGSADWMSRNFFRRMEVMFPIEDASLKERIANQILGTQLADNTKAWQLESDGSYALVSRPESQPRRDAQAEFIGLALDAAKAHRKPLRPQRPKAKPRKVKAP
jgi:polyphosphate kinase